MIKQKLLLVVLALIVLISTTLLITAQEQLPLPMPNGSRLVTELITYPDFEVDTNADKLPDGWDAKNTDADKSDKIKCNKGDQAVSNTGNCAFLFRGNPDGSSSKLQQTITNISALTNGAVLNFSAYIDPRSGVPGSVFGKAIVNLTDDSKTTLELRIPASINQYVLISDTAVVNLPVGVAVKNIKVQLKYGEEFSKFYLDDVSLTVETPDPTATVVSTTLIPTNTATLTVTDVIVLSATPNQETPTQTNTAVVTETATSTLDVTATPTHTATATNTLTPTSQPTLTPRPPTATPTTVTPSNGFQLIASDGEARDWFGQSVSLSADGKTAIIGASDDNIGANSSQGSAYVYILNNGVWQLQRKLTAGDAAKNENFGNAVSLSNDGNTAIIGAYNDDTGTVTDHGSAYIFTRTGQQWTQQAKLTASDAAASDFFGYTVSLSSDGNTALVGAYMDDADVTDQGSAYIFRRSGTTWTQQAKLLASGGQSQDFFANALSLSGDGNTAIIGAYLADINGNNAQGASYIFVWNGTSWIQQVRLTAADGDTYHWFGRSVSLNGDGNIALIGASNAGGDYQGAGYVFTRSSQSWSQQGTIYADDGEIDDSFGAAVSLSEDGGVALIAASNDDVGSNLSQGSAYLFSYNGQSWVQETQLIATDGLDSDYFGYSVSLSKDAGTALVGVPLDDVFTKIFRGSAWVFLRN